MCYICGQPDYLRCNCESAQPYCDQCAEETSCVDKMDAECIIYHLHDNKPSKLVNLDLPNKTSISTIVEKIDSLIGTYFNIPFAPENTTSIIWTPDGPAGHQPSAKVVISPDADNIIIQRENGMFASSGAFITEGSSLIDIQTFTTDAEWIKPDGCNKVLVYTIGGGGGSGGVVQSNSSNAVASAGGGGGGHAVHFIESGLLNVELVIVGSGGAGGDLSNSYVGYPGESSSFGSHTGVSGGSGGATMAEGTSANLTTITLGGINTGPTTGLLFRGQGGTGQYGIRLSGSVARGGSGGGSLVGFGFPSESQGTGGDGLEVTSGSTDTIEGMAGSAGLVVVFSYT